MTYEIYRTIFIVFTILAVVTLIIAIILFFALKIPKVVGDLTGINAKKAIENIRNQNAESADRVDDPALGHSRRIAITDKITPSGNLIRRNASGDDEGIRTTKISTQKLLEESQNSYNMAGGNETTILGQSAMNETMVLSGMSGSGNETTILSDIPQGAGETTILNEVPQAANETTILSEMPQAVSQTEMLTPEMNPAYVQQEAAYAQQSVFEIEFEITFIHTNEIIA